MNISTIKELDLWMSKNCINNYFTSKNRHVTDEGYGLENIDGMYIWYHSERGQKENIKFFNSEKDAAEFVYSYIQKDKYANSHLVGKFTDLNLKKELIHELKHRDIKYWNDEINQWNLNNKIIRIFVYRCDIHKVSDLKEKYLIE